VTTGKTALPARCRTTIASFHQDTVGDWIADLACGHSQHVRHRPPWSLRPWVMTEPGRAEQLGASLECPLCGMPVLPDDAHEYKRTPVFTEGTIPAGLLRDHRTKPDVWAQIVVEAGELEYRIGPCAFTLTPDCPGIVPPAVAHQVKPLGPVQFHVEFLRQKLI
jgi:tellurite methyltransferase